jgi:hypothetical protein
MGETSEGPKEQFILAEYEYARETWNHNDTVAWEIVAIIWGGETLLLGFVVQAMSQERNPWWLIFCVSVVGILMGLLNRTVLATRAYTCATMPLNLSEDRGRSPNDCEATNRAPRRLPSQDSAKVLSRS